MRWLTNYTFGSHLVAWLAVAVVLLITIASHIGTRRLFFWLAKRKRGSDKGEREYWRMHGGE
jgi:4-amino-4-deoxy-L-arabinose transferase-like glycosyltransferase